MYGEIKDMNEFLDIVNACISHELRNPLNSIVAQTFLKIIMYTKLRTILDSLKSEFKSKDLDQFEGIMEELEEGQ